MIEWLNSLIDGVFNYLTNDLGIPVATLYGLSLLGVLVGAYWMLTSREVEVDAEEWWKRMWKSLKKKTE